MKKEYRKLFDISGMKQTGLNYIQRGIEIQKKKVELFDFKKKFEIKDEPENIEPVSVVVENSVVKKLVWWRRIIYYIQKFIYNLFRK